MKALAKDSWEETTLGQVIDIYDHKRIPLSGKQRKERQGPYPYYGASGIIDYIDDYIFDGRYLLVAEDGENLNSRKTPIAFFASGKFWVNNHAHIIRGIEGIANDYYLMSYLQASDISGYITGAAQPKLSQANLKLIPLKLPPFPIQNKITTILSSYDDLIENNERRVRILEEMAQTLYQEWFVKFRFPGHEKVRMVDSPLGKIPEGWGIGKLGDVCQILPGFAFKSKDWQKSGIPVIKIKNIRPDNTIDLEGVDCVPPEILTPKIEKYVLKNGDFLVAMTGATAGKVGKLLTRAPILLNQRVAKIDPVEMYDSYIWCLISTDECQRRFFLLADGAAQPNMSGTQIEGLEILLPPESVCVQFSEIIRGMLLQVDNLFFRNSNLRSTRDLLLPKLISGELDVSELDINIGEEAA